MKWNEWFEGFDLEPLQSDLSELCGNLPMSWEWVSLSKWLEMSDLTKPYQNEWNRWEMNELRWIEWIEGFDFVNPMGKSLWSVEGVPMKVTWDEWFDQTLSKWSESMRNEWIEWTLWESPYQNDQNRWEMNEMKWIEVNRGEMSDLKDLMRSTLWKSPYEMNEGVPIKVIWVKMIWPNTIKMNGIDEKWMNWSE